MKPGFRGEQRPLTLLSIDVKDSTAHSQHLPAEEYINFILQFRGYIEKIITRLNGKIANFTGDATMICFGFPTIAETDAVSAVNAALEIINHLGSLTLSFQETFGRSFSIRCGIHTGEVILRYDPSALHPDVIPELLGAVPNLTYRIRSLAPENSILICNETFNLVSDFFHTKTFQSPELNQDSDFATLKIHEVLGEISIHASREARSIVTHLKMIGRKKELELCLSAWKKSNLIRGEIISVVGDPGSGKSRFIMELKDQIRELTRDHNFIDFYGSSSHSATQYYPIKESFKWIVGLIASDNPVIINKKINEFSAYLALNDSQEDDLKRLLDVQTGMTLDSLRITPSALNERTRNLILEVLVKISEKQRTLLSIEDFQHFDPSSRQLLEDFVDILSSKKVMTVFSSRNLSSLNFLNSRAQTTEIIMDPLTHGEARELISLLTSGKKISTEIEDKIIERSDRVPFYIREIAFSFNSHYGLENQKNDFEGFNHEVPISISEVALARLNNLSAEAVLLAKRTSVVGKYFELNLLKEVWQQSLEQLGSLCQELIHHGILEKSMTVQDGFFFHHSLFRDALYNSLLRTERQSLHQEIANVILKIYPVFIESQTEVLANHFYQAGDFHKAIGLWTLATETCLANSAFDEARLCIERGRESIQKILKEDPLNKNYQIEELKLFNLLMSYHIATDGWCAREIQPIYLEICKRFPTIPDPLIELQILYKKRSYELFNGEMSEQINLAHKQLQLAEKTNDKKMLTVAYSSLAAAYSFALQPKAAIKFSELVKGSYNKENQSWYRVATSTDPYVISQIHAIFSIWALGKVETAEKYSLELMRFTEGKTVPFTRATSQIWNYGYLLYLKADFGNLADFATHCREYCQKQNIRQLAAYSQCLEGYSIAMTGNAHIGLEIFKVGFTNWTNLGIKMGTGFLASLLGGILAEMKLVQEGLELVLKWEIHVQNGNEPFYAIPYFLNLGKLFVRSKNLFQAKIQFQQALKLADDAEALTWSLKAILALADLEQSSQVKLENLGKFFQRVRSEEELRKSKDGILLESLMKKLT